MKCRIDKKPCNIFLDFGKMPIANGFIKKKDKKKEYFFKLQAAFNKRLGLFQLSNNPSPKKMFNKNYPFYTSSSKKMVEHFDKTANWIKKKYLKKDSHIIEVGSNDGTFLKNFEKKFSIGFEPSKSAHDVAKKNVNSHNYFFNSRNTFFLKKKYKSFDLIFGANVFCHIPNQIDLIKTIKKLLSDRTFKAFKNKGYSKNTKTQEMLGVDWEVCKAHIERQFTKGMNWKNHGEWHIDHIIPLASAKNEKELKKLCHYSNIQPLWASENLIKSDKILGQQTKIRL